MAKCSVCGGKGLGVIEVCPDCLQKAAVDPLHIKRLRQISSILSITADTDGNIKECMQGIMEIAEELEAGHGKKKQKAEEKGGAFQATGENDI